MSLVKTKSLLVAAQKNKVGIPAFNTSNLEIMQAVIQAAEQMNASIIIEISQGIIKYAGFENISALAMTMIKNASIPIALHLDHATDPKQIKRALEIGYTSVMFDGGELDWKENIKMTKQMVQMAQAYHAAVEGELGEISSTQTDVHEAPTDPKTAADYVQQTGIDCLAVSIGSVHKVMNPTVRLNFIQLQAVKEQVRVPLVLHGSSGVKEEDIKKAVSMGICKINIATALHKAFMEGIRSTIMLDLQEVDFRKRIFAEGKKKVMELVKRKINLTGTDKLSHIDL